MLRSRVNVIIWHVRSRFGSSLREVLLAWRVENDRADWSWFSGWKDTIVEVKCRRRIDCEVYKTVSVPFSF